jgi:hypothetical protein
MALTDADADKLGEQFSAKWQNALTVAGHGHNSYGK